MCAVKVALNFLLILKSSDSELFQDSGLGGIHILSHRFLRLRFMESWTGTGNSTGNSTTLQPQKAAAIETQYAVRGAYYDH